MRVHSSSSFASSFFQGLSLILLMIFLTLFSANTWGQEAAPTKQKDPQIETSTLKQMRELFRRLQKWPLREAKKAAKLLMNRRDITVPFLLKYLKKGPPSLREGCAYCLGELKVHAAYQPLLAAVQSPEMYRRSQTIFAALMKIHPEKGYSSLVHFLVSSNHNYRKPAFLVLSNYTTKEHLPLLKKNLRKARYAESKGYLLELISLVETPEVKEILFRSLSDTTPEVAYHAAHKLGTMNQEEIRQRLLGFYQQDDARLRSYAAIALILQEDTFEISLFDQNWTPVLLKSLRYRDYFVRGTAACALVNVGAVTEQQKVVEVMDRYLAPILMDSVMGNVYYKDYKSLKDLAYNKLVQLTGRDFGFSAQKWWNWWEENKQSFHSIRLLKGVSLEEAKQSRVLFRQRGENKQDVLFFANLDQHKEQQRFAGFVYLLSVEEISQLLNTLGQIDFFQLPTVIGEQQAAFYELTAQMKNQEKTTRVYGSHPRNLQKALTTIEQLLTQNIWQNYWDNYHFPKWQDWYQSNKKWFESQQSPLAKKRRIKHMIASSYGWLPAARRLQASQHLLQLMQQDPFLEDKTLDLLLLHVRTELKLTATAKNLIHAIALAKKDFAIIAVADFLLTHFSPETKEMLQEIFRHLSKESLKKYLKHGNRHIRVASAQALAKHNKIKQTTQLYLVKMLEQSSYEEQLAAIQTLGQLQVKIAVDPLLTALRQQQSTPQLQQAILQALTQIQKEGMLPLLSEKLKQEQTPEEIRQFICNLLPKIPKPQSQQLLLQTLQQDPSDLVKKQAAESLLQLQQPKLEKHLVALLKQKKQDSFSQVMALDCLRQLQATSNLPLVKQLTNHPKQDIQIMASLTLADWGQFQVIPQLIAALGEFNSRYPQRNNTISRALTKLTYQQPNELPTAKQQQFYQQWWEQNKQFSPRQWFFESLKQRGHKVTPLLGYLLEPKEAKEAIPFLLEILQKENWFLQAGSIYALQEITQQKRHKQISYSSSEKERKNIVAKWVAEMEGQ